MRVAPQPGLGAAEPGPSLKQEMVPEGPDPKGSLLGAALPCPKARDSHTERERWELCRLRSPFHCPTFVFLTQEGFNHLHPGL